MESDYIVDRDKLGRLALQAVERIGQDHSVGQRVLKVSSRLATNFLQEGKTGTGHTVISDEPLITGGDNKGPTPLEYFLLGLAFCQLAIQTIHANRMNVKLDSVEITVDGHINVGGLYGVKGIPIPFEKIILETRVISKEPDNMIRNLYKTVQAHCPASESLLKPMTLQGKLFLNGKLLIDES